MKLEEVCIKTAGSDTDFQDQQGANMRPSVGHPETKVCLQTSRTTRAARQNPPTKAFGTKGIELNFFSSGYH